MKKWIILAIGTAMLIGLAACTANTASTEPEKDQNAQTGTAENETQDSFVIGSSDERKQASGRERKGMPTDGTQQDGQTRRKKHGDSEQPTDGAQQDGQTRRKKHGDGQLPTDGTQPDGITGATPKGGSERSGQGKQKNGAGESGELTIVEPTEQPAAQEPETTEEPEK